MRNLADVAIIRIVRLIICILDEEVNQDRVDQNMDYQSSPDYGSWLLLLVTEQLILLRELSLTISLSSVGFVE